MKTFVHAFALGLVALTGPLALSYPGTSSRASEDVNSSIYELRTYSTAPGKLDVLLERFGTHNLPLFEKHGIELIGAWVPAEEDERGDRLVYLVRFPSRAAAQKAWKGFSADPDWQHVFGQEKETHGTVVTEAESVFLEPTDYSPEPSKRTVSEGGQDRLFELRIYTASENRLDNLNARFRDHTLELFKKHGMTSVLYTTPIDPEDGNTLIYFLAHKDKAAAESSWNAFRNDEEWQEARAASEADGVPLAAKVVNAWLKPTDFSPLR